MKKNKLKAGVLVLFLLGINSAFADREVGNGGGAFVCRNSEGKIESAELVDLFEGRHEPYFMNIPTTNDLSMETQMNAAVEKIKQHDPQFYKPFKSALEYSLERKRFIGEEELLLEFKDDLQVIGKKGCPREQLANYTLFGEVLLNKEIYDVLDNTNKAAVWIHEAAYKVFRGMGDQNSKRALTLTALVFSDTEIKKFFNEFQEFPIYCKMYEYEKKSKYSFWQRFWHGLEQFPEGTDFIAYPFNGKTRIRVLSASGHFLSNPRESIVDVHEHIGSILYSITQGLYVNKYLDEIANTHYIYDLLKVRNETPLDNISIDSETDNTRWSLHYDLPISDTDRKITLIIFPVGLWSWEQNPHRSKNTLIVYTNLRFDDGRPLLGWNDHIECEESQ